MRLLHFSLAFVLGFGIPSISFGTVIDSFTDAQSTIAQVGVNNPATTSLTLLPGVLGGSRDMKVTITSGPNLSTAQLLSTGGTLSYSSGSNVMGGFVVDYTNIGTQNLSSTTFFEFNVGSNDNGGNFSITLFDGTNSGTAVVGVGAIDGNVGDGVTGLQSVQVAGNPAFALVDLTKVTKISIAFDGDQSTDVTLGSFGFQINSQAVPEPSTLITFTLLATGIIGSRFSRRRNVSPVG